MFMLFLFSSPLLRSLYIRLIIQWNLCLDHVVIKSRVMVTPLIILFFCDPSGLQSLFFFQSGHQPCIQLRCFHSAFRNVSTKTDQAVSVNNLFVMVICCEVW